MTPKETNTTIHKIKVLGIAPYDGMKTLMQNIATKRNDILLDVYVGDLNKGVEIAQKNFSNNYDVIISRGGTAQLLEKIKHIPIIEVTLSVYDILRAIKLAGNYADRYALVGFPSITSSAHLLCDLLQYKIDIYTIHDQKEVHQTLIELKKAGYRMVLCDMITHTIARQFGLNAILITSGSESISAAFDQAVKLCTSYAAIREENLFFKKIIRNANYQTVIMDASGEVFFSTADTALLKTLDDILKKELQPVLKNTVHKFFKNIENVLYSFNSHRISFRNEEYAVFYFSSSCIPFVTSKYGIQFSNLQETEDLFFNSFYSITNSARDMQTTIEKLNQSIFPIMISGEQGSGKEQVARIIYSKSQLCHNPFITINCDLINDKSWNFITNHHNSPFNDNNNTIFFKNITALSENRMQQLLSIIMDTNLCRRNRILFSCINGPQQELPEYIIHFINMLSCISIRLSSLREHTEEIPSLSSLYLNSINVSTANQIIGFEPDALQLLQEYDWPYNYTQFKRILNELSLITTSPYIKAEHVQELLKKEKEQVNSSLEKSPCPQNSQSEIILHLDQSLSELNQEIIKKVLENANGNQSVAAKHLGISRTTLWRYLK